MINDEAFTNNSSLKYVELPKNVQVALGQKAFYQCYKIFNEDIDVSLVKNFFKQIKSIGQTCFYNCEYGFANGIYLYSNIQTIGNSAFGDLFERFSMLQIGDVNNYVVPSSTVLSFGNNIFRNSVSVGNTINITIY